MMTRDQVGIRITNLVNEVLSSADNHRELQLTGYELAAVLLATGVSVAAYTLNPKAIDRWFIEICASMRNHLAEVMQERAAHESA